MPAHPAIIIGAGQAGLSVSYFLARAGIGHVVLDAGGVGHAWRQRWDSFSLVTPNWTINLPGQPYCGGDPDGFMARDDFVAYLENWARSFAAPVHAGITVERVSGAAGDFALTTSAGPMTARAVVVATATHQRPKIPPLADQLPRQLTQLHAGLYRNPDQIADGGVLVVGSGQTGCQIVEDLLRAGRRVYLAVGRAGRLPRRYRGRDCIAWQRDLGLLDRTPAMLDGPAARFAADPHVSGRDGGMTVSLHDFSRRGVTLLGRLDGAGSDTLSFDGTLREEVRFADDYAARFFAAIDDLIARDGLDAPPATAQDLGGNPRASDPPLADPRTIDIAAANIGTVIWATGFAFDFAWIEFPVTDGFGYPVTEAGATTVDGLHFCGLNWLTKRKSGILYGVAEDAERVADSVVRQLGGI